MIVNSYKLYLPSSSFASQPNNGNLYLFSVLLFFHSLYQTHMVERESKVKGIMV